ncbi:homer protein homolog 1-like isoform X2 [Tachypleus tridentatus]|uniref:homer protein homolog 1-like isoform X2 n=1 Tax=Tachypleus tridentatus TaxID=6853 RepID=UPI003FD5538A
MAGHLTCSQIQELYIHSLFCRRRTEQPIFTTKAHVFHIDPKTKRAWIPASSQAISVSFFYDSSRDLYRIISVEGTKAVVNSTVTCNMTFTKTSQKFGQWSDVKTGTVYGLGFPSEGDLNKFIEKFQEVKEATRQASVHQKSHQAQVNGSSITPSTSGSGSPSSTRSQAKQQPAPSEKKPTEEQPVNSVTNQIDQISLSSSYSASTQNEINSLKSPLVPHQRSQSLSRLQSGKTPGSPKHHHLKEKYSVPSLPQSAVEAQLNSANAKKWEIELQTLKNNNVRLAGALQESTTNVEEWKKQLQTLKEENSKMKTRALELEAVSGNTEALTELTQEVINLRAKGDSLATEIKRKDKELNILKKKLDEPQVSNMKFEDKLKVLLMENEELKIGIGKLQEQLDAAKSTSCTKKATLEQLNQRLAQKIQEFRDIQQELASFVNS